MAVKIQVKVFWVVMPCSVAVGYQHYGLVAAIFMVKVLQNIGILLQQYTASLDLNIQCSSYSVVNN
jgi:N-acyl-L-homoserine lactone synthetase